MNRGAPCLVLLVLGLISAMFFFYLILKNAGT